MKNIIKTFKRTLRLLILVFVCILPKPSEAQENNEQYRLLFVDKSVSMETTNAEQDKHIYKEVKQACMAKKAVIEIRFVNQVTSSLMNKKLFIYNEITFNESLFEKEHVALQRQLFKGKIRRNRKKFIRKIIDFINRYDASAQSTELLSGIVSIVRLNAKNAIVYFYSDAVESSRFRDLTNHSFTSERNCITAARSDIAKLRKKFQLPKTLSGIKQIRFVVPVNMEANNSLLQFLEVYWKEVYRYGFGFENVIFETL